MKRLVCLIMVVIFLVSTWYVPAFSAENSCSVEAMTTSDTETRNMVIEKAIQAFPEYEEKIMQENVQGLNTRQLADSDVIVVNETRFLSENEAVQYTEYANGLAALSFFATAGKKVNSTVDGGYYTLYNINAWLTYIASSDVLMVYGIECNQNDNGRNSIDNLGSIQKNLTTAGSAMLGNYKLSGTENDPAYVDYSASFTTSISTGGEPFEQEVIGVLRIYGNASVEGF